MKRICLLLCRKKKSWALIFRNRGYDYMNFRCWIGLWTALILLIMVVTDASYLVKYITRFTGKFEKNL
jgi:hypothetical protein